jgi:hypothetical protein
MFGLTPRCGPSYENLVLTTMEPRVLGKLGCVFSLDAVATITIAAKSVCGKGSVPSLIIKR